MELLAWLFSRLLAMDMISKTTQGIEQSTLTDDQKYDNQRIRPPRAFYCPDGIIRNYDIVHANLLLLVPKLRYRIPEMPEELLHLDMSEFFDAWILEEKSATYEWSVLIITKEQLIRIVRFTNHGVMRAEAMENSQLREIFDGQKLIQIYSVNSFSRLRKVELYEDRMLDIEFDDGRELLLINDKKAADAIVKQINSIVFEINKERQEQSKENALLYRGHSIKFKQGSVQIKSRHDVNDMSMSARERQSGNLDELSSDVIGIQNRRDSKQYK